MSLGGARLIITLDEYKVLADVKGNDQDARIEALIPVVEEDYLLIRNKPFDGGDAPVYPTGAKLTAAEMISYKLQTLEGRVGTSAESIGGYSMSFDSRRSRGYPSYIVKKIASFVRAR